MKNFRVFFENIVCMLEIGKGLGESREVDEFLQMFFSKSKFFNNPANLSKVIII